MRNLLNIYKKYPQHEAKFGEHAASPASFGAVHFELNIGTVCTGVIVSRRLDWNEIVELTRIDPGRLQRAFYCRKAEGVDMSRVKPPGGRRRPGQRARRSADSDGYSLPGAGVGYIADQYKVLPYIKIRKKEYTSK